MARVVQKITVEMAAQMMHKSAVFVREAMKREVLDIGIAMQMPGSTRWTFHISPPKLAAYLGITTQELMACVDQHNH